MKLAILLTVFNRKESTLKCLHAIKNQNEFKNLSIDIYLTNDGCTDGTPEAVKTLFPDVLVIDGDGNLFWNRGMHKTWETASKYNYDYYLWLNDDTFIYTKMIERLMSCSMNYSDSAIIVAPTKASNSNTITYGGRLSNGKIPNPNGKEIEVKYFNGNIVLIPKSVFEILGNLDPYFTHSKGDFDYGLRANKEGIKIIQVGEVLGVCDSHTSIDKWCDPQIPLLKRLKHLHKPNGMPPKETFHLNLRHYGLKSALVHYFSIYVHCIFPTLWKKA